MPYNFVADGFNTMKLSSSEVQFYMKTAVLRFWALFEGLGATYNVHLRLIGKRIVDFLLVLIKLLSLCVMALWGAMSKNWFKIGIFAPTGSVCLEISGRSCPPTIQSSCHKTRVNDLSCGIRMWAQVSFVLSKSTCLTDRQTDGQKSLDNTVRCFTCSCTVKTTHESWVHHGNTDRTTLVL